MLILETRTFKTFLLLTIGIFCLLIGNSNVRVFAAVSANLCVDTPATVEIGSLTVSIFGEPDPDYAPGEQDAYCNTLGFRASEIEDLENQEIKLHVEGDWQVVEQIKLVSARDNSVLGEFSVASEEVLIQKTFWIEKGQGNEQYWRIFVDIAEDAPENSVFAINVFGAKAIGATYGTSVPVYGIPCWGTQVFVETPLPSVELRPSEHTSKVDYPVPVDLWLNDVDMSLEIEALWISISYPEDLLGFRASHLKSFGRAGWKSSVWAGNGWIWIMLWADDQQPGGPPILAGPDELIDQITFEALAPGEAEIRTDFALVVTKNGCEALEDFSNSWITIEQEPELPSAALKVWGSETVKVGDFVFVELQLNDINPDPGLKFSWIGVSFSEKLECLGYYHFDMRQGWLYEPAPQNNFLSFADSWGRGGISNETVAFIGFRALESGIAGISIDFALVVTQAWEIGFLEDCTNAEIEIAGELIPLPDPEQEPEPVEEEVEKISAE